MSTKRDKRLEASLQPFSKTITSSIRRKFKPYSGLRSTSQLLLHSANTDTTTTTILSQAPHTRRTSRAPAFQVFCDADPPAELYTRPLTVTRPLAARRTANPDAMFGDKENAVPEFEHILLPSKKLVQSRTKPSTQTFMLAEKSVAGPFDRRQELWGGKTPFSACSPTQPHHAAAKTKRHGGLDFPMPSRAIGLEASIYRPTCTEEEEDEEEQRRERMQEVTSLVAQLELETNELVEEVEDDEATMQDPLPIDAVCPGAPNPGNTFTLPKFDYGADEEFESEEAGGVTLESKSSRRSHQMSPLAEVTEAYTGLQGGWSPPLESFRPVLSDQVSNMLPLVSQEMEQDEVEDMLRQDAIFSLDNFVPRLKRRREVLLGIETAGKAPMRI